MTSTTGLLSGKPEPIKEHETECDNSNTNNNKDSAAATSNSTISPTSIEATKNEEEQMIPQEKQHQRNQRRRRRNSSGGGEYLEQHTDKSESTIPSSDETHSEGSEFGVCDNMRNLEKKMPQIRRDIAQILKLNVKINYISYILITKIIISNYIELIKRTPSFLKT